MSFIKSPTKPEWVTKKRNDVYPLIDYKENAELCKAVSGKIVLVTGAGTGIGKAIAEQFALAGAATVIATGRRMEPLEGTKASIAEKAPKCKVFTASCDVSDPQSVETLFTTIAAADGPGVPNVLVNNSAIGGARESLTDRKWAEVMSILGTNFLGPFLCSRGFIKQLNGQPGTIINISSLSAIVNIPGRSDYQITKTSLNRFTECLQIGKFSGFFENTSAATHPALENESNSLRVFATHPGAVLATEQGARIPKELHSFCTETPELSAGICLWLMTPDADFMKGRYLDCTWDLELLVTQRELVLEKDLFKTRINMS